MNLLALTLLFLPGAGPSHGTPSANLDFGGGSFAGWESQGNAFYVTTARRRGPSLKCGVCSSDRGTSCRTGLLSREFVVPGGAGQIRFTAYATRAGAGKDWKGNDKLDVLLAAPGQKVVDKWVRTNQGWQPAPRLLPRRNGRPREYCWNVSAYVGRTLQIVIGDDDDRPGCHVFCSGFHILGRDDREGRSFATEMVHLTNKHRMPPAIRYDSRHFTALSNADDKFTRLRLNNCESIYRLFFDHFRRKGFQLQEPSSRLMVAIFDSQSGFEAYLGQKMSPLITGMYHHRSNRLVVYDYARNQAFVTQKQRALDNGRKMGWRIDQKRYAETVHRQASEYRSDTNIGTTMHEVAHQLSFNSGMLNREGDVPVWLAEGLATYCEATDGGAWQGIGAPNPERLAVLATQFAGKGRFYTIRQLASSDDWLRRSTSGGAVLLGYSQSWALFRMLMEEQPRALRRYLELIDARKAPDHRLTDFGEVFGPNLSKLENRYQEYLKKIVRDHHRPRR